ncbi:MAG: methyltransferase domain-containing protein [Lachnospiraceae bacterium]|nr:methyltransferase domain-containing protein [Lachnospiraceae bacterium]
MDSYTGFAEFYDLFMDNIPYEEWSNYLISLLKEYNVNDGIVLDMGCGTGNITEFLARAGYDMIGIDNSEDMLMEAMNKRYDSGLDILYLCQDMRDFELYGTVAAAVSICDSMNYIIDYNDLVKVFSLVNNYLDPNGLFIFDLNTIHKYETMGDCTIAENRETGSFIWENSYFPDKKLNQYDLTIFAKDEDERYTKFEETHIQRGYTLDEIKSALTEAGLIFIDSYSAFSKNPVSENDERIYIIAREYGKAIN